jgi:hypothetical protein
MVGRICFAFYCRLYHSEGVRVWSSKAMTAANFETDDGHKKPHSLHHVKAPLMERVDV